eukprot:CAMPEP_0201506862 /NCGR_PEP_ID=MMETSP0161_2-20130828/698_1 /ASSEMBLY_ACC=CAM_ASM_000251 /TAXON_ID=180227 /ORGANISM="Neoparamoeba aestuarina, Strain SoJaBio B1-5/56/2" /LENGTH=50 /DNA_ID=CAMNT_0047901085 /DNA_START=963 /DNA_END=1112 /DNA_ORIENTATION=+
MTVRKDHLLELMERNFHPLFGQDFLQMIAHGSVRCTLGSESFDIGASYKW